MRELGPDNAIEHLRETGRLDPRVEARAELLSGGVSNVVLRIRTAEGPGFVLKQARERLRTTTEWRSRLDRIWREAELMRELRPLLPRDFVPRILFEDRPNYLFAMEAAPDGHAVWKEQLLSGRYETRIADRLGESLGTLHEATAGNPALRDRFGDRSVFAELRVDPFYRRIAEVHPPLCPAIEALIDEMFASAACIVHADYSPKNVLVVPSGGIPEAELRESSDNGRPDLGLTLVDYETGHYGDPAFDNGFFLSHLFLKAVRRPDAFEPIANLVRSFWNYYQIPAIFHPGFKELPAPLQSPGIDRRTVLHLAACMLARVDGTSPVEYLPGPEQRDCVRRYCRDLLLDPPARVWDALDHLKRELERGCP